MKKVDRTLMELITGILIFGILCQVTVVWFVENRLSYSVGLWMGVCLAVFGAVHMWWVLDRKLELGESDAVKGVRIHSMIRYFVYVLAMGLIMVSGFANPLSAFLGLMGLKAGAYMAPFLHKFSALFYGTADIETADSSTEALKEEQ